MIIYVRGSFVPSAKAEAMLVTLGYKRCERMDGKRGWSNSIRVDDSVFTHTPGAPGYAGTLRLQWE